MGSIDGERVGVGDGSSEGSSDGIGVGSMDVAPTIKELVRVIPPDLAYDLLACRIGTDHPG